MADSPEAEPVISNRSPAAGARRFEFLWLCGLILSFAYERPLMVLTPYDRLNPRLYHVMLAVGIVYGFRRRTRLGELSRTFRVWRYLVVWFCLCAVIWAVAFLPSEFGRYSLFFAGEYAMGLAAIYLAARMHLSSRQKKAVIACGLCGGVFVALYCISERWIARTEVRITEDKSVTVAAGTLLGPLGSTYFHLVQYQSLACCLACSMASLSRKIAARWGWIFVALFIAWPLFFSGSRSGLGLFAISMGTFAILDPKLRRLFVGGFIVLGGVGLAAGWEALARVYSSGLTAQRMLSLSGSEGGEDSVKARLLAFTHFNFREYKWGGLSMPFIGSGFYVAPVYDAGEATYRVGFGVHNIYLFPLEQAGLAGLLLFVLFLACAWKGLSRQRRMGTRVDRAMASAMLSFLAAILVIGLAGQIFWRGFGTENFNTYVVIMILLAIKPVVSAGNEAVAPSFAGGLAPR